MEKSSDSTTTIISIESLGDSSEFSNKRPLEDPLNNNIFTINTKTPKISKDTPAVKVSKGDVVDDLSNSHYWIPASLRKYAGLVLTLIASLFLSLAVLTVKILGRDYGFHPYSVSFWRYSGVVLPSIPIVYIIERQHLANKKESVFATVWPLDLKNPCRDKDKWWTIFGILIRGLLGGSSVILRYYSLEYLSIADTQVITYATPVLVTIMAHFCLGEKSGIIPFVLAIATFCGVLVMTRPPFLTGEESYDQRNLIGIALAAGSLVCSSLIVIITRKIRKVDFSLMTLFFGLIGVIQALFLTQIFHNFTYPTELASCALVFALMSLAFVGQMAIILALTMEQAGPVALLRSCDVIFAFIFQFLFLGVIPDILSAVGGTIVVLCISIIGFRKWLSTLPEDDDQRQRYRFLLI